MQPSRLSIVRCASGFATVTCACLLGACATYRPLPLPEESALTNDVRALQIEVKPPQTQTYRVDLSDGLDLTEIAIIAVLNNPQLKAQRAHLQVAGAQLFATGLLPDPHLSAGLDVPTTNAPGLTTARSIGLSYDLIPLITRQARISADRAGLAQVRLDLLWQEWQTVQQARSLAIKYQFEEQRLAMLRDIRDLYETRYRRSSEALAQGNVTINTNGTDLAALLDNVSQINQLEQTHNDTDHSLHLLLGLKPGVPLQLNPVGDSKPMDATMAQAKLSDVAQRRPDLLALQAGYRSQEARVHAAVLAQFPSFSVGIARARDTTDVYTDGFTIGLTLPLFSRNRGPIAIERATRAQLREEYQVRLAQAETDVNRLLVLQNIIGQQLALLAAHLPRLQEIVLRARHARELGDIDPMIFFNMETTWVTKQLEDLSLQQTLWQNRIALETLLALPEGDPGTAAAPPATAPIK